MRFSGASFALTYKTLAMRVHWHGSMKLQTSRWTTHGCGGYQGVEVRRWATMNTSRLSRSGSALLSLLVLFLVPDAVESSALPALTLRVAKLLKLLVATMLFLESCMALLASAVYGGLTALDIGITSTHAQ